MPKVVDHEQRRSELGAAVWRIASRNGLEAVTLRAVASEAGWSTGALHHYFSDKEELLLFAFEIVADRSGRRISAVLEAPREIGGGLYGLIAQLLPLDAERRSEVRVWFAFLGLALTRPALARAQRDAYRGCRELVAQTLREAQGNGEIDPGLDADREATELVAFADGLALQAIFEPRAFSPARQVEILDERLAALGPRERIDSVGSPR